MGIDQSLGIKGFSCLRIDVFIRIYPEFCANLTKTCTNKFFICFPRYLIRGVFFLSSTYYFRGFCSSKCVDQKCTILLPLFKVNNCNTRTMHEICWNVTTLLQTCIDKFFICFPRYLIRVFFLSSTEYFRGVCSSKCVDQKCTIFLFKCNKDTRTTSVVLLSLLLTSNRFHTFVVLPIAHFNQVNNG